MDHIADFSELSDEEVVALALERRKGAYAEIVRRYGQRVYMLIYSIVGTEARALDLSQDTFLKVALFLRKHRPEKSFAAWVMRIAYRTARKYVKRRPLDSGTGPFAVSLDAIEASGRWATDPFDLPTPDPGTSELRTELEGAMSQLTPVQRQVVQMHVLEQRTYEEIARDLRLPLGTVKSHFSRAINKLRKLLAHLVGAPDEDQSP